MAKGAATDHLTGIHITQADYYNKELLACSTVFDIVIHIKIYLKRTRHRYAG